MFRRQSPDVVILPVERTVERAVDTPRSVTIHEHRAPTDDSVKLLKEMQEKAESKVIEAVRVGNTIFECVVHREHDMMSDQMVMRAIFKLNGVQETAEHRYGLRNPGATEIDAWIALRDKIAVVIATKMIHRPMVESRV